MSRGMSCSFYFVLLLILLGTDRMPVQLRILITDPRIRKVCNHIHGKLHTSSPFFSSPTAVILGDCSCLHNSHKCYMFATVELSQVVIQTDPRAWPLTVDTCRRCYSPQYWTKTPNYQKDNTRKLETMTARYTRYRLLKEEQLAQWNEHLTHEMQNCKYFPHSTLYPPSQSKQMPPTTSTQPTAFTSTSLPYPALQPSTPIPTCSTTSTTKPYTSKQANIGRPPNIPT